MLVSGITVIAAMAGMYFGGAATFMSFATGTILVVAIAVIGSLTVLPAILSKLGDRVNKGRVPFLRPERRTGEPRAWAWVLDRVLQRPLVAMLAAGAVLVVLAIPVLHIHTADSGVDGLPRSLPIMQTYDRMQAAFPGETSARTSWSRAIGSTGPRSGRPPPRCAGVARESDQFQEPVTVDFSPDGRVAVVEVPLAGTGTDERSTAARERVARRRGAGRVRRHAQRRRGRGDRLHRRFGGLQRPDGLTHLVRVRVRLRDGVRAAAGHVPLAS